MKRQLISLLAAVVLLANCGEPTGGPDTWDMDNVGFNQVGGTVITRSIDREAGVVCWVYANGYQGGISCLPLSETTLEAEHP